MERIYRNRSLEASRGSSHLESNGVILTGEQDIFGMAFDSNTWAPMATQGTTCSGGDWNGTTWSGTHGAAGHGNENSKGSNMGTDRPVNMGTDRHRSNMGMRFRKAHSEA